MGDARRRCPRCGVRWQPPGKLLCAWCHQALNGDRAETRMRRRPKPRGGG